MTATRKTPTTSNYGATIPDATYGDRTDSEVEALWSLVVETLGSVAGTNAITAACTPTLLAYNTKYYSLTPANSNTGAVTLNIDSLGAKNVKTQSGTALTGGELAAGVPILLYYTGTEFRIAYPLPSSTANALALNYLSGFTLSNNAGDTNNYIGVSAGVARDSINAVNMLGTAMVKKLNLPWIAGTNQGCVLQSANLSGTITITTNTSVAGTGTAFATDFQAGDCITSAGGQSRRITAVTSNTAMTVESAWGVGEAGATYKRGGKPKNSTLRIFALYKDADASVDFACSMRDTPADLPAGYSKYRRIGYVLTDSSANNRQFNQNGDTFVLTAYVTDAVFSPIGINISGNVQSITSTSSAPPNVIAMLRATVSSANSNAANRYAAIRTTTQSALSATADYSTIQFAWTASMAGVSGLPLFTDQNVQLDSSSQLSFDVISPSISGAANDVAQAYLKGWIDRRGRDG